MSKIPTAQEFAEMNQYDLEMHDEGGYLGIDVTAFSQKLIQFAEMHREAALEKANKNATIRNIPGVGNMSEINSASILDSYPPENIK